MGPNKAAAEPGTKTCDGKFGRIAPSWHHGVEGAFTGQVLLTTQSGSTAEAFVPALLSVLGFTPVGRIC